MAKKGDYENWRVVDFFCGAGGFSEGFHQAGFDVIRAYDIWEPAIVTHNKNHPNKSSEVAKYGDVYNISILPDEEFEKWVPDSEVIIGSPPCVAFSNSNKSGKGDKALGIKLLESYLRIVARKKFKKDSKLKYWILENVSNVQSYIKDSYTMEELELEYLGDYVLDVKNEMANVYNTKYYGVPSNRKRYICGEFCRPVETNDDNTVKTLRDAMVPLGNMTGEDFEEVYDPNFNFKLEKNLVSDLFYVKEIAKFEWNKAKRQKQDKGYMGKMSFPENLDRPARTVMATMSSSSRESMIFPYKKGRYRYPTIREVATIMSFPIDYRFYGDSDSIKYKLVGNAVPPKFSYALAKAILIHEGKPVNEIYIKKTFPEKDSDFCDLNYKVFELKVEKEKKYKTKFKYHVPYLIIRSYRTELLNEFVHEKVVWKAEIHKSQGNSARIYTFNNLNLDFMDKKDSLFIDRYVKKIIIEIGSFNQLQRNYCMPIDSKIEGGLKGPEEILGNIRELIDERFHGYNGEIYDKNEDVFIPEKICISYYILKQIIGGIEHE
ncbi:DNA cytosine methyltransferase [Listeria booriae]|uniref:Cytosine-specific methyltransferase n=1 Tax=Listeria booriae TaxID=1552123 RepID=A0A7X1BW44_9LIST|nr:DNA cytosine methyltransferase [Listeria booriae]MBC1333431.1 DNA cytosine methyltransferase [Listeria booriae]MBC2387390.1 DNA cytosine methyltransferase [Listeria booriae]